MNTRQVKYAAVLVVVAVLLSATTGSASGPSSVVRHSGATIIVTSTQDKRGNDGRCTLREAIIAANTNSRSGSRRGECLAGKNITIDTIILANRATYSLRINSSHEDAARNGDLDILDNSAPNDLVIEVKYGGTATISQDAVTDDRVLQILGGATVTLRGLTLTGGDADESADPLRAREGDQRRFTFLISLGAALLLAALWLLAFNQTRLGPVQCRQGDPFQQRRDQ